MMRSSKGLVLTFMFLLVLACLYQYCLTIPTSRLESRAMQMAKEAVSQNPGLTERQAYAAKLDSLSYDTIFSIPLIKSFTYTDLKKSQLAMGLDLKGGMSVLLQVELKDVLKSLAGNTEDEAFNKALAQATELQKTEQSDYITLFARAYKEVSGGKPLAQLFARSNALRDEIKFDSPDQLVVQTLRSTANKTVEETYKRLKERIDKLGVVQPNVSLDAARDLILVELPGIDNPERARQMLQRSAKLEFWSTYRPGDNYGGKVIAELLQDADILLKARTTGDTSLLNMPKTRMDTSYVFATDSLGNVDSTRQEMKLTEVANDSFQQAGPLLSLLTIYPPRERGSELGVADKNKINAINEMLALPEVRALFPADLAFRWTNAPEKDAAELSGKYTLYGLKIPRTGVAPMDGEVVTKASAEMDTRSNQVQVSLRMNSDGARIWSEMTTAAAQAGNREVAITLDNEVVSAPSVNEPITGGSSSISGSFNLEQATDLANILEVGKLPAGTTIVQESQVGPSLGKDNINKSLFTMILSVSLLCLFMWVWYAGGGLISIVALLANIFFLIGVLASMGTVLTLPGIAGIVLTLAAAVDANVIIYERIREELRAGLPLERAISIGFSRALPAILDANITTFMTAIVLIYFGLGPIKGFGTVLVVGILTSMFTAILLSRILTDWWTDKGRDIAYSRPFSENYMSNAKFDWMGKRRMAYIFSGALILLSIFSFATRKFELGVDFKGGNSFNVQFDKPVEIGALRESLVKAFNNESTIVKTVSGDNTYNITTSYLVSETGSDVKDRVIAKLHEGIGAVSGAVDLAKFKDTGSEGTHIISSSQVGANVADDIRSSSQIAGIVAMLLIFVYLLFRFGRWQLSAGAVLALVHDVVITLGFFSLLHGLVPFSLEIDQSIIACILTVIGFSVNDTVIVFDRIREYMNIFPGAHKHGVVNKAINSTLSRTIITSGTIFVVVFLLFVFGGSGTKGFAFGMLVGTLIGTYSSIFIASAVSVDLVKEDTLNEKALTNAVNESAHTAQVMREGASA